MAASSLEGPPRSSDDEDPGMLLQRQVLWW